MENPINNISFVTIDENLLVILLFFFCNLSSKIATLIKEILTMKVLNIY